MTTRADKPDTAADVELRELLDRKQLTGFVMVAGAGSGKTTSLVKALTHVASTRGDVLKSRTQRVACITYTEIAAKEIHGDVGNDPLVLVSTIHSFLWSLARPFQRDIAVWVHSKVQQKLAGLAADQAGFSARTRSTTREKTAKDVEKFTAQLAALAAVKRYTYGTGSDYGKGVLGHEDVLTFVPELIMNRPLLARLVAAQFPFVFVDESQDTFPNVVTCLKHVETVAKGGFCLGFFGDPMQQIYQRGAGNIDAEPGWSTIQKPENFRSSLKVLEVVNQVRADADGLTQISGLPSDRVRKGEVFFFVLPTDEARTANLEAVRQWLDAHSSAGNWTSDNPDEGAKILMIVHRMAARRLGFDNLYAAFHDNKSKNLSEAFDEGTAWPVDPFVKVIIPISSAPNVKASSIIAVLRKHSSVLSDEALRLTTVTDALTGSRQAVTQLREIVSAGGVGSVGRALTLAHKSGLIGADPRLSVYFGTSGETGDVVLSDTTIRVLDAFMECDTLELLGYFKYINQESPYSTQHGTKGSEFSKVIVVLDDDEGKYNLYSYEKLLGLKELSDTDNQNRADGTDSVIERTRRLMYVCVSRAAESLAVVLHTQNTAAAVAMLRVSGLPGAQDPLTLEDLRR
jgi:DNA helicase-2/ATP-dependent DNA helicase PcrA